MHSFCVTTYLSRSRAGRNMRLLTVAQMREVERAADAAGLRYAQMMQNAGSAAAAAAERHLNTLPSTSGSSAQVLLLIGPGNNGGDGLVCAKCLHDAGITVQAYLQKPRAETDPLMIPLRERGIFIADAENDQRWRVLRLMLNRADVIVDALLGTGTSRQITGDLAEMLDCVRTATKQAEGKRASIIALDGVTGMNYDTGELDKCALSADMTVTFHAPKRGHYCFPAAGANGELIVAPIGIEKLDEPLQAAGDRVDLADVAQISAMLPVRRPDANKGTHGRVVVIGGCADYAGAPSLAARAAYRVGAGLVTCAVPRAIQTSVATLVSEATFVTLDGAQDHLTTIAAERLLDLLAGLDNRHAIVLGPGIGQHHETNAFVLNLLAELKHRQSDARLVLDADGLNVVAQQADWAALLPSRSVLTPHPGEMSRLTGLSVAEVQADRIGCALRYAQHWGHVVLLKGAYSVVAQPNYTATVLPFGNAALAVAGTGDVLAGCIGGMLAQGLDGYDAAVCGAYLHAMAAELWSAEHGNAGLLASDLLPLLPHAQHALQ